MQYFLSGADLFQGDIRLNAEQQRAVDTFRKRKNGTLNYIFGPTRGPGDPKYLNIQRWPHTLIDYRISPEIGNY